MAQQSGRFPTPIHCLFHNAFTCEYLLVHSPPRAHPNYTTQTQHNGPTTDSLIRSTSTTRLQPPKRYVSAVSLATGSVWEVPAPSFSTCFKSNWTHPDSNFTGFFFLNNLFLILICFTSTTRLEPPKKVRLCVPSSWLLLALFGRCPLLFSPHALNQIGHILTVILQFFFSYSDVWLKKEHNKENREACLFIIWENL